MEYAVGLLSYTVALHFCMKYAGERLYGKPATIHGKQCGSFGDYTAISLVEMKKITDNLCEKVA